MARRNSGDQKSSITALALDCKRTPNSRNLGDLWERIQPLITKLITKLGTPYDAWEDARQSCYCGTGNRKKHSGMLRALATWDPGKSGFSTYLTYWLVDAIQQVGPDHRMIPILLGDDDPLLRDSASTDSTDEAQLLHDLVALPPKQLAVLERYITRDRPRRVDSPHTEEEIDRILDKVLGR